MLVTTSCGKFQLELYDQDNQAAVLEFESLVDLQHFSNKPVLKSDKYLAVSAPKTSCPPVDSLKLTGAGIVAFLDSQLIISVAPIPDLQNASIFGRVSQGLAVVEALRDSSEAKEVLALYRKCIRAAHAKSPEAAPNFEQMARLSFKKYQGINTKEFTTIEHLLRKGYRSLEIYGDKQVKKCTPVAL